MNGWRAFFPLGLLMAVCLAIYSVLPSAMTGVYASPDETAHAVTTQDIASHARISRPDQEAFAFPWLHPRSWVSQGSTIVPVGFIGWSVFLVPWQWLVGMRGLPWIGALILVSGIWPFFCLVRAHFGSDERRAYWGAFLASALVWTFPSFIVYGNRSLFPNGPVLVAFLWSGWFMHLLTRDGRSSRQRLWLTAAAAGMTALALSIRPVEAIWMLPWWIWFGWGMRLTMREQISAAVAFIVVVLPSTILAAQSYGSWFTLGYWLHDRVIPSVDAPASILSGVADERGSSRLPYGFHPRHMWWNIRSFFVMRLWMWTFPAFVALLFSAWHARHQLRAERIQRVLSRLAPVLLALWTTVCLTIIYGSGLYTDHIRTGTVAIANSFLRYTLPIACFIGISVGLGYVFAKRRSVRLIIISLTGILVAMGVYQAGFADDEGIWRTRQELLRYATIRDTAREQFSNNAVIFSERSDKVFFSSLRAVSPMPSPREIARLARTGVEVGLFARPLSQEQKDRWRQVGFDVQEVASFGRERLYALRIPSSP